MGVEEKGPLALMIFSPERRNANLGWGEERGMKGCDYHRPTEMLHFKIELAYVLRIR